jgi:hypothetical protein
MDPLADNTDTWAWVSQDGAGASTVNLFVTPEFVTSPGGGGNIIRIPTKAGAPSDDVTSSFAGQRDDAFWVDVAGIFDLSSSPPPSQGPKPANTFVPGRFFTTSRGDRGGRDWSSCTACHPDGMNDSVTWAFARGPHQTRSSGGSSTGPGADQRAFNWTAILDEVQDFESNTHPAPGLAGDFNGDGKVDAADYVHLRSKGNGAMDAADYNLWRSNFGRTSP